MAFTLVTLRWYHGGTIEFNPTLRYRGGQITEYFDVDTDTMSYFELIDYIKELGYTTTCLFYIRSPYHGNLVEIKSDKDILVFSDGFENGDIVDIFVAHEVDEVCVTVPVLEYGTHVRDSGVSFNEASGVAKASCDILKGAAVGEPTKLVKKHSKYVDNQAASSFTPAASSFTPAASAFTLDGSFTPVASYFAHVEAGEPSSKASEGGFDGENTENSSDSEHDELFEENDLDYGSDVHEEYKGFREKKNSYQRRKRSERPKNVEDVSLGEAGIDLGYDEYAASKKKTLDGLIGGDEPYYESSEAASFETSDENPEDVGEEVDSRVNTPTRKMKNNKVVFDPTSKKIVWETGMVFESVTQFRDAVTTYAVQRKLLIDKYVNERTRVRVRCCKEGCPWLLYASLDSKTQDFVVKNYNPVHKCVRSTKNYLCNSNFLAKRFQKKIRELPNISIVYFQDLVRKKFGLHVGKTTCRRARAKVIKEIMGDHVAEFKRIYDYKDEILRTNPGTTCVVKVGETIETGQEIFEGFYVCFDALKKAFFSGVRRCIGLDGCFLKGLCKGQLLVAVCKDGNNQMLPVAWAVVEYEHKHTWTWFIELLKKDLELGEGHELTLITDMQKGLYAAVQDLLPFAEHRMCARHILANWSKNWRRVERRNTFWRCARSTFEAEFIDNLDALKKLGPLKMVHDLLYYNKDRWCKVYFKGFSNCDAVDNNMEESFNAWILSARHKTIISMLEEIRIKVMKRIGQLREFSNTWITNISPMAFKKLSENIERSMQCSIDFNGDAGYEIVEGEYGHTVDLRRMTCSCRSWRLRGIPCPHAIAAMHHKGIEPMECVADCYRKDTYLEIYSHFIQPLKNMKMWQQSDNPPVLPPQIKRMPGRPKKLRRKEATESKKTGKLSKSGAIMSCSSCRGKGHNKRGCPKKTDSTPASTSTQTQNATQYEATTQSTRGRGRGREKGRGRESSPASCPSGPYKRPRMVGMGLLVADNGFTALNPGLSSRRVIGYGGAKQIKRSAEVTGDIGYQPMSGVKWKGNQAVTSTGLEKMRTEKLMQKRASITVAKSASQSASAAKDQVK